MNSIIQWNINGLQKHYTDIHRAKFSKKQVWDPTLPSQYEDTMDTSKTIKQMFITIETNKKIIILIQLTEYNK